MSASIGFEVKPGCTSELVARKQLFKTRKTCAIKNQVNLPYMNFPIRQGNRYGLGNPSHRVHNSYSTIRTSMYEGNGCILLRSFSSNAKPSLRSISRNPANL